MTKIALIGLALFAFNGPTEQRPKADVAPFRMTLESTPTGWSGHCDSGCAWIDATVDCVNACSVRVNFYGLDAGSALPRSLRDSSAFLFVVERTDGQVRAVSRRGTAWTTLGWSCGGSVLRAVVDGFGVVTRCPERRNGG